MTRSRMSLLIARAAWAGIIVLVAIGVVAGVARWMFVADLAARLDPFRERMLAASGREDPLAPVHAAEMAIVDGRFARHSVMISLHVLAGALFLGLAPLQLSSRIRGRYPAFHRWSGRLLVVLASLTAIAGLFFGVLMPYAGTGEASAVALFGGLFLVAIGKGFIAIRRGNVGAHREWMIRAFGVGIGISTVRVVAAILDVALTPAGFTPARIFVLSIWIGWTMTVITAEVWLARTRPVSLVPSGPNHLSRGTTNGKVDIVLARHVP
jgi:uncharacterized membrane protein